MASALNHSAERVQTLWFSFLTFMLYLAIATGTTTHRMLFLEEPLNLPVLNIILPLLGFYVLTPIILVVFHFYMLLNLVLLARTAKSFEDALVCAFPEDGEARENFRMRIENTLFVQLLVGVRPGREGINAKLLSVVPLITLVLAPVALLLMFQVTFLPFHSEPMTWWHRSLFALDLFLVGTLWPGYRSGWGVRLLPKQSWRLVWPAIGSAAALVYAVAVATFPDDVRHVDFSGAILNRANLRFAWANEAHLNQAQLKGASLDGARLQGASLVSAQLQAASLDGAQLQGASLDGAQLQGASFVEVCAWRAAARGAFWKDTRVTRLGDAVYVCNWPAASFAALKQLIAKEVPEGDTKHVVMERIEQRLDPTKTLEGEDEMAKIWATRESDTPPPEVYERSLAGIWREQGCAADGAPYLLHGLITRLSFSSPFRDQSDAAKALAVAFLDEGHCAGAHGLSEEDKAKLKEIAAPAAPPAPKP